MNVGYWCDGDVSIVFHSWVDPFGGAALVLFAFPDGDVFFERVDEPLGGGEGVGAVGGADDDGDAGFGGGNVAQSVDDAAFYHGPAAAGFGFEVGESALGHFVIGFVVERDSLGIAGEFARGAEEEDDGAGVGVAGAGEEGGGGEGGVC